MPIVLSNFHMLLGLGTPVVLGRGPALLIVPNHLHLWLGLGRAWSWASTRGGFCWPGYVASEAAHAN